MIDSLYKRKEIGKLEPKNMSIETDGFCHWPTFAFDGPLFVLHCLLGTIAKLFRLYSLCDQPIFLFQHHTNEKSAQYLPHSLSQDEETE